MVIFKTILKNPKITLLIPDKGRGATSGQAHLVLDQGRKYVLRKCSDEQEAKEDEYYCKKIAKYGIIPKFHRREGKNLLLEYVEGRNLRKNEKANVFRQMGEIVAKAHRIKARDNIDKRFILSLNYLKHKKVFDAKEAKEAIKAFFAMKRIIRPKTALDVTDITPDNFIIDSKGKVYWVDIEGLRPYLKGRGMGKAYTNWFNDSQKKEFKKGYEKISSMEWFTQEYAVFAGIYYLVCNARVKVLHHVGLGDHEKKMKNLMQKEYSMLKNEL